MKVKPILDSWEIPRIASIKIMEHRDFVEMPVPGREGSIFQNLNAAPARIEITGSLYGDDARDNFLHTVREKFKEGGSVTFVADITTATTIQYVVIEDLRFEQYGAAPDEIQYAIWLRESPPPQPPAAADLDASLMDDAGCFLDSVTGALDAAGLLPDISDPTAPLAGTLEGVNSALAGLSAVPDALSKLFGK